MADRNVKVLLSLVVSGFDAGAQRAKASAESLAQSIEKTGEATAQAEKDAAKAGADAAKRAADAKQALGDLSTVALTVGGAILAGVGVATKAYADFDKQMSAVKATGQDAVANFDALRDAAIEAGASTAFSASEAAAGMEAMMKAGMSAENVIAGGLKSALDLAASGNMSVADSADFMATAMNNFSIEGADSVRVADAIAAAANKAQGDVSDMANAFKYVSIPARDAGMSLEMTAGAVAQLAEAGIIGEQAGTSLRSVLMSLTAPSKIAQEAMDDLGITLYDTQGKFLGYENAVQQLQDKLGPLSDAQRDMALGTIFGNESISAARVLMEGGADAARKWAAAVSEQGYASALAATKLDNLAGDLEELGGAFESAFIKGGSGVNDFLRGFVQAATGLVNVIGSIPGPVLALGTGLAGLAGAGLVVAGGLGHAIGTFIDLRANVKTLRDEFPKLDSAMSKASGASKALGKAAVIAGVALAGMGAATAQIQSGIERSLPPLGDIELALAKIGSGSGSVSQLDSNFKGLEGRAGTLSQALQFMAARTGDNVSAFTRVGDAVDGLASGLLMAKSDVQGAEEAFSRLDAALVSMDPGQAAAAFAQIKAEAAAAGVPVEILASLFPQYAKALQESANASGGAVTAAEALSGGLGEVATEGTAAVEALTELGNQMLSLSGSQMGFEGSLDAATEAIKEHGQAALDAAGMIDITSEKGRTLQGALDDVASSALSVIDNMVKTGAASEDVAAFQQRAAAEFMSTADAMGLSTDAAIELAAKYGLIPEDVATAVSAPGATLSKQQTTDLTAALMAVPSLTEATVLAPGARPSKAEVDAFVQSVGRVPGLTEAQIRTLADLYGVEVAKRAIASVQDKTVTVRTVYRSVGSMVPAADGGMFANTGAGLVRAFASGGMHTPRYVGSFRQPGFYPYAGKGGVIMNEEGSGPWELIVSGNPAKRRRSRWLLEEGARRLGGNVAWATPYADGGFHGAPTYYAPNYTPPVSYARTRTSSQPVQMPSVLVVRDVDGALIGRMRVEASGVVHETVSTARGL